MKASAPPVHQISLRVRELGQLFNSMDPTPFHHKDLDPDAEEFIESWAHEFPPDSRFQIVVHLQQQPAEKDPGALVSEALHNFFDYKAGMTQRELRRLLRVGRVSLVVGLAFLALCLLAANAARTLLDDPYQSLVRESLTIVGWVAMWRPIQIFLYEWWPITRRRRVYESLSRAQVRVLQPG
jgi:hypothetical protein